MNDLSLRTEELGYGGYCVRRTGGPETQLSSLCNILLPEGGERVWGPTERNEYGRKRRGICIGPSPRQTTVLERMEQK